MDPIVDEMKVVLFLEEWRAQREAGFTEQRPPPSPNGGGIAGYFLHNPKWSGEPSLPGPAPQQH
ncbi:unnamed protein product [Sphenostylis stenocarpa]|uniref:Uncharacterized protein n=1 Tax=Sphenostylis stenocarpa TaxID=92480 RepID=A0AA86VAG6_9FABA|nr:unnamed protein product [Sphenostylis stenocarpa]